MQNVESLSYKIDKARQELRDGSGKYREATKREKIALLYRTAKKEALKLSFAVVVAECVMVGVFAYAVKWGIYDYFQPKTVIINVAQAKEKPANTQIEVISQEVKTRKTDQELLEIIHKHESGKGTAKAGLHKTCEAKGLSNEYGYNPPTCYKDKEALTKIVLNWITDHKAQGMSDSELLAHYSNNAYTN
jgi:hypothetical protein